MNSLSMCVFTSMHPVPHCLADVLLCRYRATHALLRNLFQCTGLSSQCTASECESSLPCIVYCSSAGTERLSKHCFVEHQFQRTGLPSTANVCLALTCARLRLWAPFKLQGMQGCRLALIALAPESSHSNAPCHICQAGRTAIPSS